MDMEINGKNRIYLFILLSLLLAFGVEVFLFNCQYFSTKRESEIVVPLDYCSYQGLKEQAEDGSMILDGGEEDIYVQFSVKDSGIRLKNLALQISCTNGDELWWGYLRKPYARLASTGVEAAVLVSGTGENKVLRDRLLYGRSGEKDIINLPDMEGAEEITLQLKGLKGSELKLSGIYLNTTVPLSVMPIRVFAIFLFFTFLYMFRPGSVLWTDSLFGENGRLRKRYLAAAIMIFAALLVCVPTLISQNQVFMQAENGFRPYTDLARALAKGQLYLDLEPSEELLALENPYDPLEREEFNVPFQLDYAFYEGKYYIYFGVIPCLLLYLPWYIITRSDMPGWLAMSVMLLLCYSGCWFMIKNIIRRYRRKMAAAPAMLIWMGAVALLSLPAAMGDANNYYAPMLAAVDFFFFGMAINLAAADLLDPGNPPDERYEKKGRIKLVIGSLLMACIAGCRPQLVLGAACTLPLLLPVLFVKKEDKIRPDIKRCVAFALPYVCVAVLLMIYNALRFGSPFDFGAMKNLTFAFLDNAGFNVTAAAAGIFYYLFRLPVFSAFYPYLDRSTFEWSNPNMLAIHPSVGGMFMLYPLLILAFACFLRQKDGKGRELKWIGIISLILVPVLAAITAVMGGLMDRYRMDIAAFAALAFVCGAICFASAEIKRPNIKILRGLLLMAAIAAVIISGLTYATEGLNYLKDVNPESYMAIAKAIEFWR